MIQLIDRWKSDEEGTTMTEFIITVPMFIVAFVGVMQLGLFTEKSVKTWARAHANTFQLAIPSSRIRMSPMAQPSVAAGISATTMTLGKPINQPGLQRGITMGLDGATYAAMGWKGHWGESNMRTKPVDMMVDMRYLDNGTTQDSSKVLGNSELAKNLVDEEVGDFSGSGSGALSAINGLLSGSGLRPAMAAGMRYGAVGGFATDSLSVAGRTMSFRASFTSLVPPYPHTGFVDAQGLPTALTRITMEDTDQYKEILGIKWSQPYPGGSLSVDEGGEQTTVGFPGRTR